MTITAETLKSLQAHWALDAIGEDNIARAFDISNKRLVQKAVQQITFDFREKPSDDDFLERVALAYELAAIEGLDALSRSSGADEHLCNQAESASHQAFDIRRLLKIPQDTRERLFHVMHLSALAYCGDRWSDLRRWFKDNESSLAIPTVADASWDQRLLYRLFDCWTRLFRKNGWDDLDRIREIIAGLREDQKTYEASSLKTDSEATDRMMALRLIALYHWAKATEILALYMIQGEPQSIFTQLDKHFESGIKAASASGDAQHEIILRWLHATSRIMVTNSLWWGTRTVNSRVSKFVKALTKREHKPMFELLPPQRAALLEQGLLDQAKTAIVIDMPTSGGKTLLAQFRILQALNQFDRDNGWVAYVAPTRALSAQITRRLRQDFEPIGIKVEQLTGAVEIDTFEDELLNSPKSFDVLVSTPEKLSLVIRNKKISRPLALIVMDEAHNMESEARGLRIELLLATIKRDCPKANFLLLMPFVESSETIARWLAQDVSAGKAISFSTTSWKPNERIIGLYKAVEDSSQRAGWRLAYETLTVTEKAIKLKGKHRAGGCKPINVPKSKVLSGHTQKGLGIQTVGMAVLMSGRGTSIAIANNIKTVWSMARNAYESLPVLDVVSPEIKLVQDYLKTEVSPEFELIDMLQHGVAVHHSGLSDEIRSLIEWLAEGSHLKVLCATSTIAQGINFPVSSIFLQSHLLPYGVEMSPREFWNLAGRAGRIGQDSVGVIGIAESTDRNRIIRFISNATGALASRLITLLDELEKEGELANLSSVLWQDQWQDFRCYIAHLLAEKKNLDAVLAESEQLLRQTYGYTTMRNDPAQKQKADALLEATKAYARKLSDMPGMAELADSTGFSPEGVQKAGIELRKLEEKLSPSDWTPESLFGEGGKMADLFGVMLQVPQLKQNLDEIGGSGVDKSFLSRITKDWVNGKNIQEIAKTYFSQDDQSETESFTNACKAIYKSIVNNGTWGVSALSRVSGIDFEKLDETEKRRLNSLPAMIYHGVRTEDAILMRMNNAPRSVSESLGTLYRDAFPEESNRYSISQARTFLKEITLNEWNKVRPEHSALSAEGYKKVWQVLSGETS